MMVPATLMAITSSLYNSRAQRITQLYNYVAMKSLSEHKTHGHDKKPEGWVAPSYARLAKEHVCSDRTIRADFEFLVDNGFLENDGIYSKGIKKIWLRPSEKAFDGELIEVEKKWKERVENLEEKQGKRIMKDIKNVRIDFKGIAEELTKEYKKLPRKLLETERNGGTKTVNNGQTKQKTEETCNIKAYMLPFWCPLTSYSCLPPSPSFSCYSSSYSFNEIRNPLSEKSTFLILLRILLPLASSLSRQRQRIGWDASPDELKEGHSSVARLLYATNRSLELYLEHFYLIKSNSNHRVRHNLVEFPRKLRKFFYMEGKTLTDIDLANSQPAILVGIMLNEGINVAYTLRQAVKKGDYYEVIQHEANLKMDRDDLKAECLKFFYSQPWYNKRQSNKEGTIAWAFKKLWPKEFEWIVEKKEEMNAGYRKDRSKLKGKQLFAIWIQKKEASWMFNKVFRRLYHKNNSLIAIPMHDGIITTKKYESRVKQVMEEEFYKLFNFKPTVRSELLIKINKNSKLKNIMSR